MDTEFTDAEIRTLLRKAASDRQRYEIRQRMERGGDLRNDPRDRAISEGDYEIPPRVLAQMRGG